MRDNKKLRNIPNQAFQVLKVMEELFVDELISVYLYGSAILGGLHIDSDIDILVIVNQHLSETMRSNLTKHLMLISGKIGCRDIRPLEVIIVNKKVLTSWSFPPKYEYIYGEWLRKQIEDGVIPQAAYEPDLAICLWQARSCSISLKGPEAIKIIKYIPKKDIKKAIKYSLPSLLVDIKGDERNVLLTLSRMWYTAFTGKVCSKDSAAKWAIPKLPKNLAILLETACKAYLGEYEDYWDNLDKETVLLVKFMQKSIEKLLNN